jgi:hypothetical protein
MRATRRAGEATSLRWGRHSCLPFASICLIVLAPGFLFGLLQAPLYSNDFESAKEGEAPADLTILNGAFMVKPEAPDKANKVLELPGDPVDGFAFLFGPADETPHSVSARIRGSAHGKRFPEFGIGLGDTSGWKLWLMPAIGQLQLLKGEEVRARVPYAWQSGSWTTLHLEVRDAGSGKSQIKGKAWPSNAPEPHAWTITAEDSAPPPTGRASAWGTPYASTPIQFDDLAADAVKP